ALVHTVFALQAGDRGFTQAFLDRHPHTAGSSKLDEAERALDGAPPCPIAHYQRAVVAARTRRWPDALTALAGHADWDDPVLAAAAATVAGSAAAQLGR
ncbi:hypothetical protein PJN93_29560, partial [Mycobacterium kansasii]